MAHSLTILSIADFYRIYEDKLFSDLYHEFNINVDEKEYMYDWLVIHSLSNVFCLKRLNTIINKHSHYKNDLYSIIYRSCINEDFYLLELSLANQIEHIKETFFNNSEIKALVSGENLILSRYIGDPQW